MRRNRGRFSIHIPTVIFVLISGALFSLVMYVPPINVLLISLFIILTSLFFFYLFSYFVEKKFQYMIALTVLLFLTMNYFVGFQVINALLLLSIMGGISYLLK